MDRDPSAASPLLRRSRSQDRESQHSDHLEMDGLDKKRNGTAAEDNDDVASDAVQHESLFEELGGKTLLDKKTLLINRFIDEQGMGRYQWMIWGLCGLGYFIDLMWAQAFGLVLSPLEQEFGFGKDQSGNISVAFNSGLTAGAFVWGFLVDIIGRRWAFNLTVFICSLFGLFLGVANTYTQFLVLTAFCGFGLGGSIPIDTTICLEFIPQNKRFLLVTLSAFQPMGVVVTSIIAFGFIPNYGCKPDFTTKTPLPSCRNVSSGEACCSKSDNKGWRYLMFTIGGITLFIFFLRFLVFKFQESPKFLVARGHDEKAVAALEHIARANRKPCTVTLEMFEALTTEFDSLNSNDGVRLGAGAKQATATIKQRIMLELARYKLLFENFQMARLSILIFLIYICDFTGFTVAGFYLPTILATKNGAIGVSLKATYASYIYIYAPGIIGVLVGSLLYRVPIVGRKWGMVISSGLMGVSIFLFSTVNDRASNIGFNVMEYFFQSMFNSILYAFTPEVFPTPCRGSASGLASFFGRLFGIVSPLIAQHLFARNGADGKGDINSVLYLAGGVTLGCVLFAALLPGRVIGRQSL